MNNKSYIPNMFTFLNLSLGMISLICSINKNYTLAAIFIILAAIVDRYDGKISRYLNASSELGKELDSLCDLVSFGVAPAILTYMFFNLNNNLIGLFITLIFPVCGALRLARFNVSTFDGSFSGVPITIAGIILPIIILFSQKANLHIATPIILTLVLSYCMISKFKLKKF